MLPDRVSKPREDDPFAEHRGLLFTVAYEMLGSTTDAEDVVQESYLRWADVVHEVSDARTWSGSSPDSRSTGCAH